MPAFKQSSVWSLGHTPSGADETGDSFGAEEGHMSAQASPQETFILSVMLNVSQKQELPIDRQASLLQAVSNSHVLS